MSAILAPSCQVKAFDKVFTSQADLSAFHMVAWSLNPSKIPKEKSVIITEPGFLSDGSILDHGVQVLSKLSSSRESREALSYNVIIHIHGVEDFALSAQPVLPFAPSSDDSGFDGLPSSGSATPPFLLNQAWRS